MDANILLNRRKVASPAAPHPMFSHLKNEKPGESLVHNLMYMYEVKIEKMLEKACLYCIHLLAIIWFRTGQMRSHAVPYLLTSH